MHAKEQQSKWDFCQETSRDNVPMNDHKRNALKLRKVHKKLKSSTIFIWCLYNILSMYKRVIQNDFASCINI